MFQWTFASVPPTVVHQNLNFLTTCWYCVYCLGPQHDGLLAESEGGDDSTKKSIKQTQEKIVYGFLYFNFVQLHCSYLSEREVKGNSKWPPMEQRNQRRATRSLILGDKISIFSNTFFLIWRKLRLYFSQQLYERCVASQGAQIHQWQVRMIML